MTGRKSLWLVSGLSLFLGAAIGVFATFQYVNKVSDNRGRIAWALGNQAVEAREFPQAIFHFNQLVAFSGDNYDAHIGLGRAYEGLGLLDVARKEYERAVSLITSQNLQEETEKVIVLVKIGDIYQRQGLYTEALRNYEKASAINSNWPDVYYGLGVTYYKIGQIQRAKENLSTFLKYEVRQNRVGEREKAKQLLTTLERK